MWGTSPRKGRRAQNSDVDVLNICNLYSKQLQDAADQLVADTASFKLTDYDSVIAFSKKIEKYKSAQYTTNEHNAFLHYTPTIKDVEDHKYCRSGWDSLAEARRAGSQELLRQATHNPSWRTAVYREHANTEYPIGNTLTGPYRELKISFREKYFQSLTAGEQCLLYSEYANISMADWYDAAFRLNEKFILMPVSMLRHQDQFKDGALLTRSLSVKELETLTSVYIPDGSVSLQDALAASVALESY